VILHKLVIRYLRCKDDVGFYHLQAQDAIRWLEREGVTLAGSRVLDLGCGHGLLGGGMLEKGSLVTFADAANNLLPEYAGVDFRAIDVDKDDIGALGSYDLVICSNVLEHIPRPAQLLGSIDRVLNPGGKLYLSWTNWLSPWGGQDYSPFHYLGPRYGHLVYDRVIGRPRTHIPYVTLFPTSIGGTIKMLRQNPRMRILHVLPRYYPELAFITRLPVLKEFLTLNCLIFAERLE
jgi:2-polyprenyl-3-methyl-5-hydroxy-6-metoxy-1,4-benzoquinol methylase